jgi:hypothetical protein
MTTIAEERGKARDGNFMRGLPTLIRLARRKADERRIALAEAERQTAMALDLLAAHDTRTQQETEGARLTPESMALWSAWAPVDRARRQQLAYAVEFLQGQEEALRDSLREHFAEIKRLEIALDQSQQAARRLAARKAEREAEDTESRRARQG